MWIVKDNGCPIMIIINMNWIEVKYECHLYSFICQLYCSNHLQNQPFATCYEK